MSNLAYYINSFETQDEELNKEIRNSNSIVFFNWEIFTEWPNATFHAKHLPLFQGELICTCPLTYKWALDIFTGTPKLMWRPEIVQKHTGSLPEEFLLTDNTRCQIKNHTWTRSKQS